MEGITSYSPLHAPPRFQLQTYATIASPLIPSGTYLGLLPVTDIC